MMTYTLDGREWRVSVVYVPRHGGVRVTAAGEIIVRSRKYPMSAGDVRDFLNCYESFLRRTLARVEKTSLGQYPVRPITGDPLFYRGGTLILRFFKGQGSYIKKDCLYLGCDGTADGRKRALDRWYLAEAKRVLIPMVDRVYAERFADGAVLPPTEVRVRAMTACWGNCRSKTRVITLNSRLLGVPEEQAAYVIVHELVHFAHRPHDDAFWAMVQAHCPDAPRLRRRLNGHED